MGSVRQFPQLAPHAAAVVHGAQRLLASHRSPAAQSAAVSHPHAPERHTWLLLPAAQLSDGDTVQEHAPLLVLHIGVWPVQVALPAVQLPVPSQWSCVVHRLPSRHAVVVGSLLQPVVLTAGSQRRHGLSGSTPAASTTPLMKQPATQLPMAQISPAPHGVPASTPTHATVAASGGPASSMGAEEAEDATDMLDALKEPALADVAAPLLTGAADEERATDASAGDAGQRSEAQRPPSHV